MSPARSLTSICRRSHALHWAGGTSGLRRGTGTTPVLPWQVPLIPICILSPRAFSRIGARLPNLLVGSWGVKIEQGLDVSAHNFLLFLTLQRGIEDLLNASLSRQRSETRQKSRAR